MGASTSRAIQGGAVLSGGRWIDPGVVVIDGEMIAAVGPADAVAVPPGAETIDATGRRVTAGFIDIHVHGSAGAETLDATAEAMDTMSRFFATRGVTAFAATAVTAPHDRMIAALRCAREVMAAGNLGGADLLGVHVEGPFLNRAQKGCHDPALLIDPTPEAYTPLLDYADAMVMMTLAPELPGAVELVRALRDVGVVAAMGHSDAIIREMAPAIDAGITHAVHCFCNANTLRRDNLKRVAGAVETILADDRITTELIADGWHLGDTLMKLAVKVKGVDRVAFVTDAMSAAGMPPGRYFIGDVEAIVDSGIARLPDNTAYASSVTTMDVCVRNGADRMGLTAAEAIRMATTTPAAIVGVNGRKGDLAAGMDADVVIMDQDLTILRTFVRGRDVYSADGGDA